MFLTVVNLHPASKSGWAPPAAGNMTGLLPHPDGEGSSCVHCDAVVSSVWRPAGFGSGHVCRCNDCWREEGWLPAKKKRGRKSKSDPGADIDLVPVGTISSITKIEAQRCASHDPCPCPAPAFRLRALPQ